MFSRSLKAWAELASLPHPTDFLRLEAGRQLRGFASARASTTRHLPAERQTEHQAQSQGPKTSRFLLHSRSLEASSDTEHHGGFRSLALSNSSSTAARSCTQVEQQQISPWCGLVERLLRTSSGSSSCLTHTPMASET